MRTEKRGQEYPNSFKNSIIEKHQEGYSSREIGRLLQINDRTVRKIVGKFYRTGQVENLPRSGRPRKISQRDLRVVLRKVKKAPRQTGTELRDELREHGVNASAKTVKRSLSQAGYKPRRPRKKPLLKDRHVKGRLDYAKGKVKTLSVLILIKMLINIFLP